MVQRSPTKPIPIGRLLVGIVAITALLGLGRQLGGYLPEFAEWVDGLGWWGPLIFMAGYVAATVAEDLGVTLTSLPDLLARSDFVCLHAVSTDETRGLINRDSLGSMKEGAFLLNLARGDLVESLDVLEEALETERLAGVALDVFSPEPPDVGHPIFKRENCITSPHAFGMTERGMARSFRWMAEDMVAVFSGQQPKRVVNPEVLAPK